jgi:hypothetical protein
MVSWPILRSNSPIRCNSVSAGDTPRRPMPGKANSPRACHSPRQPFQQMGTYVQVTGNFPDPSSTVNFPHRRNLQISAVDSPGQIHTPLHSM